MTKKRSEQNEKKKTKWESTAKHIEKANETILVYIYKLWNMLPKSN